MNARSGRVSLLAAARTRSFCGNSRWNKLPYPFMSRRSLIVLKILAIGLALTFLTWQILFRHGGGWASSSKSGRALSPREINGLKEEEQR